MSNRSKVVLIALSVLLFLILTSLVSPKESVDDRMEEWEAEITDPNNNLNPLEREESRLDFILEIPRKVENIINKLFAFIFGFFEKILI